MFFSTPICIHCRPVEERTLHSSTNGLRKTDMSGLYSPNHRAVSMMFSLLIFIGNSFIIHITGHIDDFDDLNIGPPSVFQARERFS